MLLVSVLTLSMTSFYTLRDTENSQYKAQSTELTKGCLAVAILRLSLNPNYAPSATGDLVSLGDYTCMIRDITNTGGTYPRSYIVHTEASLQRTFSIVEAKITINDPYHPPHIVKEYFY